MSSLPTCRFSWTRRMSSRVPANGTNAVRPLPAPGRSAVVPGEVVVGENPIGRIQARDTGEPDLLLQAVLQSCEHPLRAAAGFRQIRRDQLDSELAERPVPAPDC